MSEDEGLRIHHLYASNVLRLEVVDIDPAKHGVVVGGKNNAGKSSVLNAIAMAIGGGKQVPTKVLRDGQAKGEIVLDLGPFRLTRTWRKNDNGRLKIEAKDERDAPSGQKLLDRLYDSIAFDPFAWSRLCETTTGAKQQREDLLRVASLSLDLDANLRERGDLFAERTRIGRERDSVRGSLASEPVVENVPAIRVEIGDLLIEFTTATEKNGRLSDCGRRVAAQEAHAQRARLTIGDLVARERNRLADKEGELARWEKEIETERVRRLAEINELRDISIPQAERQQTTEREKIAADLQEVRDELAALGAHVDLDEITSRIETAKEDNARFERAEKREALFRLLEARESDYVQKTREIEGLDDQRTSALATARLPLEGLGFDETGVTFNDIPFDQISQSDRLRISCAMAMELNKPKNGGQNLRVLLCRDGALLDDDNLATLCAIARDEDYQIWIETVGEKSQCSIIMEDGKVKEIDDART